MQLDAGDRVYRYRVPLTAPVLLGRDWHTQREGLLVRRTIGGIGHGWGEIAPLPGFSLETLDSVVQGLRDGGFGSGKPVPPSVTCGMEMAQLQWNASLAGDSGLPRTAVRVCALLSGDAGAVLAKAKVARAAGYEAVKLKVGRQGLEDDIRLVREVRRVLGPGIALRLDANRAWSYGAARIFAEGVKGFGIAFVEEPLLNPGRLPEMARYMPVALDETLAELAFGELPQHRYAKAIVIKPMLLGGPGVATAWAEHATHLGITPVISAAYETGIGILGLLHTAGQVTSDAPQGLDTYRFIQRDVLAPRLDLAGPRITIPSFSFFQVDHGLLTRIE